jgi:hypothetical protein
MTDTKLSGGVRLAIAVAVSFGLTVLLFGFVVLFGALLVVAGLVVSALPSRRRAGAAILAAGGMTLAGPLVYVGLAVLQSV